MKIGLYSPFLSENIGGGERYLLAVAECLLNTCEVDLVLEAGIFEEQKAKEELKQHFIKAFGFKLERLNIVNGPFGKAGSFFDRWNFTHKYDAFYYMTDGSFFVPGAKRNLVHFMIPFKHQPGGSFNKLKLGFWNVKVANSLFTKEQLEKNWHIYIDAVHYGSVDIHTFKPLPKKNIVLNVGRFFTGEGNRHCKRQDYLVDVFKKLCQKGLKNWQLVLVGAVDKGADNEAYARKVTQDAKGYPIVVKHGIPFVEVKRLYGEAKIYWHATGVGLDENEVPEAMEHLGLTTIEAMAAGAVPVVIHKAGQKEIVKEGVNGLFWENEQELMDKTLSVVNSEKLRKELSKNALVRAQNFSYERFCQTTKELFNW